MATFNDKTILVCGGAGFIGSNFIHYILGKYPRVKIVNLDKLTYSGNLDNLGDIAGDKRYAFVKGDIAEEKTISAAFKKHQPDYCLNCAAETHVDRSIHVGALEFIKTNIQGVFNILEAVKASPTVIKYVQISTDEVHGSLSLDSKEKFNEYTLFAPNVPYAATKAGGDLLCRAYHSTWQVPVVVTHCSNNYGPYQYPEKIIPFFVTRMLENKKLPLYGDGKHVRDWIYVLDHCHALELCLLQGAAGGVYHIGANNELDNTGIARRILKYFNRDESWLEYVGDRPGHDRRYAIDPKRIRAELGWQPTHSFEKAFSDTVQWYIDNPKWIDRVRKRTGVFNPHIDLWKAHQIKKENGKPA
ncbi:MAG: dTDP-glucose 4,6-dehydratase [Candidatus Taylorbacteria bacterium]|nr:dTDP-glucose 4,6-dehydratase [Candidatus Taylorbacteria bacterium]